MIPEVTEAEENIKTKEAVLNDFNQAWQEVKNGEIPIIEQLWLD